MIDISYASREPQILIKQQDSDDPRDKLISMLSGQAMPGVRDGYCKIERVPSVTGGSEVVITPIHPIDMIAHIPAIAIAAEMNPACDTSGVPKHYREIIEREWRRVGPAIPPTIVALNEADKWAQSNLPPDLYKKWVDEVLYRTSEKPSKQ